MPNAKTVSRCDSFLIVEANRNPKLAQIINENWATFDGQWPYVLAKWKARRKDIEKISGSDFVYELCAFAAGQGRKVFLLGAAPEVNRESCRRLRRHLGVECAGYSPQVMEFPFPAEVDREILSRLESFRPDILVVCLGSPKQEFWADLHRNELECIGVRWVIGAGGTLDFIAGTVRRAPVLLQRMGLEGLWRLGLEPRLRIARVLRAFKFLRYA